MADSQIVAVIEAFEKFTSRVVQKITLDVTANLIEFTPVLTGWARANWVPAIGKNHEGSNFSGSDAERAALVPGAESIQQAGIAGVALYHIDKGLIFVSNNVPYIEDLNSGSSKQAPAAFVQGAIDQAVTQDIKVL